MAGSMMTSGMKYTVASRWVAAVFSFLVLAFSPLHAENLPDPTRPPAEAFAPASRAGTVRGVTAYHPSGLHLIIISKTRRAAIIDGKTVELGGKHGKARLIEVNEGSVVLQRGQSRQVLTLFPGVKITRKEMPDTESVKMEPVNNEMQVNPPSSAIEMRMKDHSVPTEHEERK